MLECIPLHIEPSILNMLECFFTYWVKRAKYARVHSFTYREEHFKYARVHSFTYRAKHFKYARVLFYI